MTIKSMATALILAAGMATAAASYSDAEEADREPREAGEGVPLSVILKRLEALGYRHVTNIGFNEGVYSVTGHRVDGNDFSLTINARTGEIFS